MRIKLFLGALVCWFLISCNPNTECPPSSKVYYENLILKVPYQLNDSVTFEDSIGNELTFYLNKINSGFVEGYDNIGLDCGSQYLHKYEYSKYYFSEKNNKSNLWIGNFRKSDTIFSGGGYYLLVTINGDNYELPSDFIQNTYGNTTETILNGKKYNNLRYEYYKNNELYYSKEFGLVCFKTNNVTWFLKK